MRGFAGVRLGSDVADDLVICYRSGLTFGVCIMDAPAAPDGNSGDITVVVRSCQRHDLLARTLESFLEFNTDPGVARIIVVEDGAGDPAEVCRRFGAELIRSGERIGQIAAIDLAYSHVQTPYIFHLEDDWEFYRTGFTEKSRSILESEPLTVLVWLRAWNDTNGHPLSFVAPDRSRGVLAPNFEGVWHGFTFNPGLRRLSDYKRLGSFTGLNPRPITSLGGHGRPIGSQYEAEANRFYHQLGYRAVILDEAGYVRHTGWSRHVLHPMDQPSSRNAPCPCGSGKKYKHCHGALT
jgi:SEC-C motif/Glycosyl transferase family 2